MSELRLDRDVIEDGELAVSETATNAPRHARCAQGDRPPTDPELWIWARTVPSPQLIVSVFDGARTTTPHASGAGLLDEHSKGLQLVRQVTADWGSTPTRSRVDTTSVPGKTVWFALPLPHGWPGLHYRVHPGTAAHHLLLNLTRRGFKGQRSTTDDGSPETTELLIHPLTPSPRPTPPPRTVECFMRLLTGFRCRRW